MRLNRQFTDQAGMIVVIALLVMVVLTILGLSFLGSSLTESQIGSNESDLKKAFFAAEAGIQEAMYRLRLDPSASTDEGDTACSATVDPVVVGQQGPPTTSWADVTNAAFWKYNPPTCAWTYSGESAPGYGNYFGGNAANLDSAGRTFKSSGSAHIGGALVNANVTNTTSDPRSYTVTVAPVVGFVSPCWQYVDQFGSPLGTCTTVAPLPMFKVTSTGTAKNSEKVLSTMIQRPNINPGYKGPLEANTNINVNSASAIIDGKNYDCNGNNPVIGDNLFAATSPTGTAGISVNKPENLQCDAGTGTMICGGTSGTFPNTLGALLLRGNTPPATQTQIDALNAYLESMKVSPAMAPPKTGPPFHGILYVDGNYEMPPDGSTGILIVHHRDASNHDVATLGNFNGGTFKGIIIADSINKINGNAQIIGAIFGYGNAADGVTVDDVTGTPNIKYSKCALDTFVPPAFPYQIVSGTWHEQ